MGQSKILIIGVKIRHFFLILSLNFENMTVKDIFNCITEVAPLHWQEHYDNAGLQVGNLNAEAHKALICLDITEEVVDEAIVKNDSI